MKLAAIFAACAAIGFAQATITSCSPGTCTATTASISMAQYGFKPSAVQISITAPGNWSITVGAAPFSFAAADGSGPLTSGTGPMAVVMKGTNAIEALAPATYSYASAIVVAGTTLNVTLTVVNNYIRPPFSNALGIADSALGGTRPNASWPFYEFGPAMYTTDARPGGAFAMPTYGNSVTDSQLGTAYKNCAQSPMTYTGLSEWSYDGTMILAGGGISTTDTGFSGIWPSNCTGGRLYPNPRTFDSALIYCQFFRTIAGLFCVDGSASIFKVTLGTAPSYNAKTTLWTEPHGKVLALGNTQAPSADDNFVVITEDFTWMHQINLATGATVSSLDLTTVPENFTTAPDYITIMPATDAGCHDIFGAVDPPDTIKANRWFRQCGATLSFVGLGPSFPDGVTANTATLRNPCTTTVASIIWQCFGSATGNHSGFAQAGGKNILLQPSIYQPGADEVPFVSALQMNIGTTLASAAKVLGGGINTTTSIGGDMAGAASAPYVAYSNADGNTGGAGVQAYAVLTATPGTNTVTVTFSPDPALGGATVMICGGIAGITNFVNATYTMTPLGGGSYRFPLTGAAGAYTNGGACALNNSLAYTSQEIQICRLSTKDGHPIQCQRVVRHHHVIYSTDTLTYVWMSFKADGTKLLFQSNGGFPYAGSGVGNVPIYMLDNPMTATADNELSISLRTVIAAPTTTTALFTGLAPSADDVTILVSTLPDCSSPTATIMLTGGAVYPTPRTATASSLTSSTAYHWCASSANKYYAEGDFTTGSGTPTTGIGLGGTISTGGKLAVGP